MKKINLQESLPVASLVASRARLVKPERMTMQDFYDLLFTEGLAAMEAFGGRMKLQNFQQKIASVNCSLKVRTDVLATCPKSITVAQWASHLMSLALDLRKGKRDAS